ncbi:MAG: hypothetical protein ACFB14_07815 [Leptolyngbyaceae cyanobacterium]
MHHSIDPVLERRYSSPVSDRQQSKFRSLANQAAGFLATLAAYALALTSRLPALLSVLLSGYCQS